MEIYRAEVEELAQELRVLAGRRATDEQILRCRSLLNLPQIKALENLNLSRDHIIESIRDEIHMALGRLESDYELPSLSLTVEGNRIKESIRVLLGLRHPYRNASHVERREQAAREIGVVPDAQLWRRPGPGPELDLMRVLALSLYSLTYTVPTRFYVERLESTTFYDEYGRRYQQENLLQIRSRVDGLDALTCHVSYRDNQNPGACGFEALSGCVADSIHERHDGTLEVRVKLHEKVPIDGTYTLTWRELYRGEPKPDRVGGSTIVHAYETFGTVVLRVKFHELKQPKEIGWYVEQRFSNQPLRPHPNNYIQPSGSLLYTKNFGVTRRGWFYGIIWKF